MAGGDGRVVGIDDGGFGRPVEKVGRMAHEILIQGVLAGNQGHGRFPKRPADPAAALPGGHDRAGITAQDAQVEAPDVDAEFEGRGGHHGQQLPGGHGRLDGPAFLGQKPGTVGRHPGGVGPGLLTDPQADQLRHLARLGVDDGAQSPPEGRGQEHDGRGGGGLLGIDEQEMARSGRRAGFGDGGDGEPRQAGGQLAGIADGGRGEDEGRPRPEPGADPQQPAEDVGHVRAHHPPVGVHLVGHDVGEPGEQRAPGVVARQQRQMEHFRVGDEDVRRIVPDLAAEMGARVAVEDGGRGAGRRRQRGRQLVDGLELVLGQGLEGIQEDGPGVRVAQDLLEDRQQVGQGLAAGRGGGHGHMAAGPGKIRGPGLVGIEPGYAPRGQQVGHRAGKGPGRVGENRRRGRKHAVVDHQMPQALGRQQRGHVAGHVALVGRDVGAGFVRGRNRDRARGIGRVLGRHGRCGARSARTVMVQKRLLRKAGRIVAVAAFG